MRILDRYTLRPIITVFIWCVFIFVFLFVIIDVLSHLDDILRLGLSASFIMDYYLSYLPLIVVQMAPFAALLSVLYTFNSLNHTNEIVAMRASGLSILQVIQTALVFGIIVSLTVFWISDRVLPAALARHQEIKYAMDSGSSKRPQATVITNLSMYGLKNRLFFINKFFTKTNTLSGVVILEHDHLQNLVRKIVATKAVYEKDSWTFYECNTYDFDEAGGMRGEPRYEEEETIPIPETPKDFLNQRQRPEYMDIAQLDDYIWRVSKSGAPSVVRNLRVDLYQRMTQPFASFIIILLGIPFALRIRRKAVGLSSFGVSILVAFAYFILDAVCVALGKGGAVPPLVGASMSHIIALSLSVWMLGAIP
jgi:lipopolysaccharide export system permease protein